MQTIFFPMTYIPETILSAASTCFLHVIAYQPTRTNIPLHMRAYADKGLLDICIPVNHDEEEIETALKEHRNRASLHRGGLLNYFKAQRDTVPFFNETSPAQIKAEVLKQGAWKGPDPLFNARVFLQIAQEYDLKSEEINRELVSADLTEQNLIRILKGGPTVSVDEISGFNARVMSDSAEYMVEERIIAWARLFQKNQESGIGEFPRLFITHSRAAMEFLIDQSISAEIVLHIKAIPVQTSASGEIEKWRNRLDEVLDMLAQNSGAMSLDDVPNFPAAGDARHTFDLSIYRVDKFPLVLWTPCHGTGKKPADAGIRPKSTARTLLGLICIE